jgi:hypothetical protein
MGGFSRRVGAALGLAMLCGASAQAWGPGVHAMVGDHLGAQAGLEDANEIYGSLGPDVVNFLFDSPDLAAMYQSTHVEFQRLWRERDGRLGRALALGFVGHNGLWGADASAHARSLTLDPTMGYVIQKAALLALGMESDPAYQALGIPHDVTLELAHNLVENAVDLLVRRMDPAVGWRIMAASIGRSPRFPAMLADAYAGAFAPYFGGSARAAAGALRSAEAQFRELMFETGFALAQDDATALDLLADQNVALAKAYFGGSVALPDDATLKAMVAGLLQAAAALCEDDVEAEVLATIVEVPKAMREHGYACR